MPRKEINQLLDDYLSKRRKKRNFSFNIKPKEEKMPEIKEEEITIIEGEEPFIRKIIKIFISKSRNKGDDEKEEELDINENIEEEIKEEINKEIEEEITEEDYEPLEERISLFSRIKGLFSRKKKYDYESSYEYVEEDLTSSLIQEIDELEEKQKRLLEENQQLLEKRQTLLQTIINKFRSTQQEELVPLEKYEDIKNDLKEVSKITTELLKMLPKRKLDEFKNSEEMNKFKSILRKYNLIK